MSRWGWIVAGGSAAVALVAVVIVVVVAVGDDSSPADPGGVAPSEAAREAPPGFGGDPSELDAFRECLGDQGVEIPGEGGARPALTPELQAALEACQEFLPRGVLPGRAESPLG